MKKLFFISLLSIFIFFSFKTPEKKGLPKIASNDFYSYIDINQILMYLSNNGDGSYNNSAGGAGLFWPGGIDNTGKSAVYEDGILWGGKIGDEIRVGGSTYLHGLQAGKILPGRIAADPTDSRYRVYRIRKDFRQLPPGPERDALERDYDEWPVEDGAPWVDKDNDGVYTAGVDEPEFIGDEVLWFVSNDLDASRTMGVYGSLPMELELQTTVFGFDSPGDMGDIVFRKYLIINKGIYTIKDMYIAQWSDPDLGDAGDDFVGADTALSLGYVYNGRETDRVYGVPPAAGYDFVQGPIVGKRNGTAKFMGKIKRGYVNLPMSSFMVYISGGALYRDPTLGQYSGTLEMYNNMTGLLSDSSAIINPLGDTVNVMLAGDPVAGTGWYEGGGWNERPGDRRFVMSSGPFKMAPGDKQELVVATILAQGEDRLDSVHELKRKDAAAQIAFDHDFKLTTPPPEPDVTGVTQDNKITLYWKDNAESYSVPDFFLFGKNVDDSTYNFEGYRVWQFSDETGSDPLLIAIYDLANGIKTIYGTESINAIKAKVAVIRSNDTGLKRSITITSDQLRHEKLHNGSPYYFAVTAYGYSPHSVPSYLESSPVVREYRPGKRRLDIGYTFDNSDLILATSNYNPDATIGFKVVDPNQLTGDKYTVTISDTGSGALYTLVDDATNDTIYNLANKFISRTATDSSKVFDGVTFFIEDTGLDSLLGFTARIKSIEETANGNGPLAVPVNVDGRLNSTGKWKIIGDGDFDNRTNLNWHRANLGRDTYEIRFTSGGSEYYLSGYAFGFLSTAPLKDDKKAANTVPFEVWTLGTDLNSTADDQRLIIKVLDHNREDPTAAISDSTWSHFPADDLNRPDQWEQIFVYYPVDSSYPSDGVLPEQSGLSVKPEGLHKFGRLIFVGDLPEEGTVIRLDTYKPLIAGNVFTIQTVAPNLNDFSQAKKNLSRINVFPNPYFGSNPLERNKYNRLVRFINLPEKATVKIYSIAGIFITRLDKDDNSEFLDWDLRNANGILVASGIYIAHIDMPKIGQKILKLAIIQEKSVLEGF